MEVHVESRAQGGLKLLAGLPDMQMCLLEGENGIGKTATIQLIELICGSVPREFLTQPVLWGSLRDRLGETRVSFLNMHGAKRVEFTFTPSRWPSEPELDERLGIVEIEGKVTSIDAVTSLLSVVRVSGTEDLTSTLERRVETIRSQLREYSRQVQIGAEAVGDELAPVRRWLERAAPNEFQEALLQLDEATHQVDDLRTSVAESEERLSLLLGALEARRRLDSLGKEAGDLLTAREALLGEIRKLNGALSSAEKAAKAADEKYAKQGGAEQLVAEAEHLLRTRSRRLANGESKLRAAMRSLGLADGEADLASEYKRTSDQLEAITRAATALDHTSSVRSLMSDLHRSLTASPEVSGEVVADLPSGGVTAAELSDGILGHRRMLDASGQVDAPSDLAQEVLRVRRRLAALSGAMTLAETVDRDRELVEEAQEAVKRSSKGAERASKTAKESADANVAYGKADANLNAAMDRLSAIEAQIGLFGNVSEDDAQNDLIRASEMFGVAVNQLDSVEEGTRASNASLRSQLDLARNDLLAARKSVEARRAEIDLAAQTILEDVDSKWLSASSPHLAQKLSSGDQDDRLEGLLVLADLVEELKKDADDAADLLAGLEGLAQDFFEPPRSQSNAFEMLYRPIFESVVSKNLLSVLNRPALRRRLFGDGEVAAIEPGNRSLTLRAQDGTLSVRSMEAFSTGEQALAFTQARIADLPSPATPNRLLVLDEFGAFVSADRFPELIDFLRQIRREEEQVVVILPLQVDYEREVEQTTGALRSRYEERAAALGRSGYFSEELV